MKLLQELYSIKDDRIGSAFKLNYSIAEKGGLVILRKNNDNIAIFTKQDWKDLTDAVKNRVDGTFGAYSLSRKADSVLISGGDDKDIMIAPHDMEQLLADTKKIGI